MCSGAQPTIECGAKRAAVKLPECLNALFCSAAATAMLLLLIVAASGRSGSINSQHIQHVHVHLYIKQTKVYA